MSLKQFKNEYSEESVLNKKSIEDYLQSIVNISSQIMEGVHVSQKEFDKIESKFELSSTFEEILVIIEHMSNVILRQIQSSTQREFKSSKRHKSKERDSHSPSALASSNYEDLEKLVQKYEAEIREHIKIEQQMKIYTDSLEERIGDLENGKIDDNMRSKNLEKEVSKLKHEIELIKNEKQVIKTKIQLGSNLGLAISVPKHRKTQSIDTVV